MSIISFSIKISGSRWSGFGGTSNDKVFRKDSLTVSPQHSISLSKMSPVAKSGVLKVLRVGR
jgi:hypothetical protein